MSLKSLYTKLNEREYLFVRRLKRSDMPTFETSYNIFIIQLMSPELYEHKPVLISISSIQNQIDVNNQIEPTHCGTSRLPPTEPRTSNKTPSA